MSDDPVSFALAKFDRGSKNPNNYTPEEAVEAFLAAIRTGRIKPTHVVIAYSQVEEDGRGDTGYFQGGQLDYFGQQGLLSRILHLIND
jgi:hypothetical protein